MCMCMCAYVRMRVFCTSLRIEKEAMTNSTVLAYEETSWKIRIESYFSFAQESKAWKLSGRGKKIKNVWQMNGEIHRDAQRSRGKHGKREGHRKFYCFENRLERFSLFVILTARLQQSFRQHPRCDDQRVEACPSACRSSCLTIPGQRDTKPRDNAANRTTLTKIYSFIHRKYWNHTRTHTPRPFFGPQSLVYLFVMVPHSEKYRQSHTLHI